MATPITALLIAAACAAQSPRPVFEAFEVATIKPALTPPAGRYIRMQSAHRFYAKNYTLKLLVGAAYNLTPNAISGGPAWIETEPFDILAGTPGELRPNNDEQMAMLRKLLADRFQLTFHREPKQLPVYALTVGKAGSRLKESASDPDAQPDIVNVLFPDHVTLPARNATMAQFTSMLQRAVLDRTVLDQTGLTGRYDFDLEWTPDETQFAGNGPKATSESTRPDLFAAVQIQLGLRLEATKGPVQTIVIDKVEKPSEN